MNLELADFYIVQAMPRLPGHCAEERSRQKSPTAIYTAAPSHRVREGIAAGNNRMAERTRKLPPARWSLSSGFQSLRLRDIQQELFPSIFAGNLVSRIFPSAESGVLNRFAKFEKKRQPQENKLPHAHDALFEMNGNEKNSPGKAVPVWPN